MSETYTETDVTTSDLPRNGGRGPLQASVWTFVEHAVTQVFRLGGNLILTRILVPEAFGLMALVNTVLYGISMFSDLGFGQSVIQNPKGSETTFLRVVWTLQSAKGLLMALIVVILAGPISIMYGEPQLFALIAFTSVPAMLGELTSTNMAVLVRNHDMRTSMLIHISSNITGLTFTIILAYLWPSVWALAFGAVVGQFILLVLSHTIPDGPGMRFTLRREIFSEVFHFGKWIFLAGIFGFLTSSFDRLVLGLYMTLDELGVYSVAFALSQLMVHLTHRISGKVIFPAYARTDYRDARALRAQTIRLRAPVMFPSILPTAAMVIWGPEIIRLLYDDRYENAGWILQVLGAGAISATILTPIATIALARGESFRHLLIVFVQATTLVLSMILGGIFAGSEGVVVGFSVGWTAYYPILIALTWKYRIWAPLLDAAGFAFAGLVIALGFWLK